MLSKTVACTLPAVLLVLVWWGDGSVRLKDFLRLAPFFLLSIGLGIVTARMEVNHVGAKGPDWNLSIVQRFLIASRAIWFYLGKLFWPVNLTFSYPRWRIDPHHLLLFLFPLAIAGALVVAWLLRRRLGRGPLAAMLIFCGVLTPALGLFNTYPMRYSFVADHFQYTAGVAIIVLVAAALVRLFPQNILIPTFGVVLAVLTCRQSRIYAGPETLWRDVIAKNDSSWMAFENLGVQLTYKPDPTPAELNEAVRLYERVYQLRPEHEKLQINWAEAFFRLGRWSDALPHYQAATDSPGTSKPLMDDRIGIVLGHLNRFSDAEAMFKNALQLDPENAGIHCDLADALASEGKSTDAIDEYDAALKIDPHAATAWRGSVMVLIAMNRSSDAIDRLQKYVSLVPGDAQGHERLATLDLQAGRADEALKQFAMALAVSPDSESAKEGLALALAAKGKVAR